MPGSSSPAANYGIAGPSRGGFIVQTHSKAVPTVATTTGDATSLDDLPPLSLPPLATVSPRDTPRDSPRDPPKKKPTLERAISVDVLPPSTVGPIETAAVDPHLPPSLVLARIAELSAQNPRLEAYVPLIRFLTTSISIFPFPPPALAAKRLSDALAAHTSASYDYRGTEEYAAPTPSPARLYLSQAHLLCPEAPPSLRTAMLDLMVACIVASLESTGGMREAEKALFWEEARRWADEAREEVDDGEGGTRWVLPDLDREALVKVLAALTRGGRDLSEVPGLVTLLCTIVIEALPVPRPPSPLFDPNLATPFIRQIPHRPARHASALALLVALHKFSAPHIYTTSTLLALRAALEVAKLREEQDIGGRDGVLDLLGAVIRYGEVTGGKAARHRSSLQPKLAPADPSLEMTLQEGDEILREVVSCVARLIGCEGLVSVVELQEGQELRDVSISAGSPTVKTSVLPALALDIMRDLIRSPANQATKSLRSALIAPPLDNGGVRPPTPILLLVGTLRSLRKAMSEHSAEVEAVIAETGGLGVSTITSSGESRWPTMLSLGLPFLWNGIKRVMQWGDEAIDAEVLRLVEERLEAAQNAETLAANFAARNTASGASSASPAPAAAPQREVEDIPRGVSYEGWTMAIDVLERCKVHIGTWEQKHLRQWIISHDGKSSGLLCALTCADLVLIPQRRKNRSPRSARQNRIGAEADAVSAPHRFAPGESTRLMLFAHSEQVERGNRRAPSLRGTSCDALASWSPSPPFSGKSSGLLGGAILPVPPTPSSLFSSLWRRTCRRSTRSTRSSKPERASSACLPTPSGCRGLSSSSTRSTSRRLSAADRAPRNARRRPSSALRSSIRWRRSTHTSVPCRSSGKPWWTE